MTKEETMKDDGGPAFPRLAPEYSINQPGMSLRDWFAGQALIGLVIANENADNPLGWKPDSVARAAERYADAMLAERAKRDVS